MGNQRCVFDRLRDEARNNYITKVVEAVHGRFLSPSGLNVAGLIVGGFADLKRQFIECDKLDYRIRSSSKSAILASIDLASGGELGLHEAIRKSASVIKESEIEKEREALSLYFKEIAHGDCYSTGIDATFDALENGMVSKLYLWTESTLRTGMSEGRRIFTSDESRTLSMSEKALDYFLDDSSRLNGAELHVITGTTGEGSQFVKGFGGIGALLRWKPSE